MALSLPAQPPLTTIQDVLYKADGTPFDGYVEISWNSFEAGDTSNIATQFRAVRIVNGNFLVKLVPTTNADPPTTYSVSYHSDGRVQFQETWAVPPSSRALRVREVRISTPSNLESGSNLPIQESDVVGLVADLNSRPIEGPGYATGRVLVSNPIGQIEAVAGNLTDCVRVDGSSGPCGTASLVPGYTDGEVPTGVVDGSNAVFTLAGQPDPPSSLALYRNGILQKAGFDYSLSAGTVQFVTAATPQPGDTLLASYRVAGSSSPLTVAPAGEILCAETGGSTASATPTALATCVIPAGTLQPGNRVEARFDLAHAGIAEGFSFQLHWGASTWLSRSAANSDVFVTGRADAAVTASGAQLSAQSWGSVLGLAAVIGGSAEVLSAPLTITFSANLAQGSADSLALTNFTVLRYSR